MNLSEKIASELAQAIKTGNETRRNVLRMLKAAVQNKAIDKKVKALSDEDMIEVIQKQVKQRRESIEEFKKGNRPDLVEKESKEILVLEEYLPAQMDEAEIKRLVQEAIQRTGAKAKSDLGKVMKELMPKLKARADGKLVNQIVNELLS